MASKPPYFPFYHEDFFSDEKVLAMTDSEIVAYIRLLGFQWKEGSIPEDAQILSRIFSLSLSKTRKIIENVVKPCFSLVDEKGRRRNPRMAEEQARFMMKSEKRRKVANIRWDNEKKRSMSSGLSSPSPLFSKPDGKNEEATGTEETRKEAPSQDPAEHSDSQQKSVFEEKQGASDDSVAESRDIPSADISKKKVMSDHERWHFKTKVAFPKDLFLTEEFREYAIRNGIPDPAATWELFRNRSLSVDAKYNNWGAAWQKWVLTDRKYAASQAEKNKISHFSESRGRTGWNKNRFDEGIVRGNPGKTSYLEKARQEQAILEKARQEAENNKEAESLRLSGVRG